MIMAKTRVCVIFGGVSSEHDISLMSASSVIQQIPKDKYNNAFITDSIPVKVIFSYLNHRIIVKISFLNVSITEPT